MKGLDGDVLLPGSGLGVADPRVANDARPQRNEGSFITSQKVKEWRWNVKLSVRERAGLKLNRACTTLLPVCFIIPPLLGKGVECSLMAGGCEHLAPQSSLHSNECTALKIREAAGGAPDNLKLI